MSAIPDFDDTELWVVRNAVNERYGKTVELQMADAELRLDRESPVLTTCPTLFWSERGAQFAVTKIGEAQYRCQFFYSIREQYGTGRDVYDSLAECVTVLLQVQADHERDRKLSPAP